MTDQNLKRTHTIYDNFEKIAEFVKTHATEQEAAAILEAVSPLNNALNEKLGLKPGEKVDIESYFE